MKAPKQHWKLKCDTSWLAWDPFLQSNSLASGRDISQQLSMHKHWHFSFCGRTVSSRLLRALGTALISYWSAAQAWWLVTHLSRGLLTARYLKAIKNNNKKPPTLLLLQDVSHGQTLHSQRSILYCKNKASLCPRQLWGGQVQNSHRNQFLSFLSSRHLYTENHLCLQNKPLALQLYGLSQGDSKYKGFLIAIEPHITGLNLSDPWKLEKQHSPPSPLPHLQGGAESVISQASCKGKDRYK